MFCVKCGVELSAGQEICPVCQTRVYHPDVAVENAPPTYPKKDFQSEEFNRTGVMLVITILFGLAFLLPVIFEMSWHMMVTWSGYVSGGVLLGYIAFVLPSWFKRPSPAIFLPSVFAAACGYLLYINFCTEGDWFLTFAFPITGALGIIVSVTATLVYYIGRGRLYIIGGSLIALGAWTVLIELLIWVTFGVVSPVTWSMCSFATFFILGMSLIVIGIVKPVKESLRRIFFIG